VLQGFLTKTINLAPPQFIMLNIMASFHKFEHLRAFLNNCANNQLNMGPNVISLVKNNGKQQDDYPYAGCLLGDSQFPYDYCLQSDRNEYYAHELLSFKTYASQQQ
jgi:hypothetical protein